LGVLLFVMVCGRFPFDSRNENNQVEVRKVFQQIISRQIEFPPHVSSNCINLIKFMLTVDQTKRPTVTEVRAHAWFQKEAVPKNVSFKMADGVVSPSSPEHSTDSPGSPPRFHSSFDQTSDENDMEGISRTLSINLSPLRLHPKNYELESPRRRNSIISPRKFPESKRTSSPSTPTSPRTRSFTSGALGLPSFLTGGDRSSPDSPRVLRGTELPSSPRNYQAITLKSPLATQQHGMNIRSQIKDFFNNFKLKSVKLNGTGGKKNGPFEENGEVGTTPRENEQGDGDKFVRLERASTSPKGFYQAERANSYREKEKEKKKEKEKEKENEEGERKEEKRKEEKREKLKTSTSGFSLFLSHTPRERSSHFGLASPRERDKDREKEKSGLRVFSLASPKVTRRHSSYSNNSSSSNNSNNITLSSSAGVSSYMKSGNSGSGNSGSGNSASHNPPLSPGSGGSDAGKNSSRNRAKTSS